MIFLFLAISLILMCICWSRLWIPEDLDEKISTSALPMLLRAEHGGASTPRLWKLSHTPGAAVERRQRLSRSERAILIGQL